MHLSVFDWVADRSHAWQLAGPTLEVGSLDVNGSCRGLIPGRWLGVDAQLGPGVDIVADAERFLPGTWPVVLSTEMLEHCRRPWLAIATMCAAVAPGGHLLLTCRGYDFRGVFPVHDYPADYWRFSCAGLAGLVTDEGLDLVEVDADPEAPGVFLAASRASDG